jgi:hypothetical protein
MKQQPNSQTAYQYNAHSSSSAEVNDHGWADAVNRMIDQRYAFLALEYENNAYLFRGMSSGLFDTLLDNRFWHYSGDDSGTHFEKELDILLLSQDLSDALTISKLWEQKDDACIIVFRSEIFNQALKKKKAAMLATAEPGVVFKYPFLTQPLTLDDIEYLIISTNLLDAIENGKKSGAFNKMDDSKFSRFTSVVANIQAMDKLLVPEYTKENVPCLISRSDLEKALIECLLKREVTGAKVINSNIKPTRKT